MRAYGAMMMNKLKPFMGEGTNRSFVIGDVTITESELAAKSGIDITGKKHVVTSSGLQHAIKHHGVNAKLKSYEVPVTEKDLELIPDIQRSPDKISVSDHTNNQGEPVLVYEKRYGDQYYYLEKVSDRSGNLETQTMYINKKEPLGANQNNLPNDHGLARSPKVSDVSIAKNTPNVNSLKAEVNPIEASYIAEQIAAHASPQEFRNSTIEGVWSRNKKGQGVDTWLTPDEYGSGYSRRNAMSNNTPFYQAFYAQNGYKPTKKAIVELVDSELAGKQTILSGNLEMSPVDADIYKGLQEREDAIQNMLKNAPTKKALDIQKALDNLDITPEQRRILKDALAGEASASSTSRQRPQKLLPKSIYTQTLAVGG